MPASKKTAPNDALEDNVDPETSILMESSDDAEMENDENYETETETETDCTTESDDEDNNGNHPRYVFFSVKDPHLFYCIIGLPFIIDIDYLGISFSFYSTDLQLLVQTCKQSPSTSCSYLSCCCYSSSVTFAKQTILQWRLGRLVPKQ